MTRESGYTAGPLMVHRQSPEFMVDFGCEYSIQKVDSDGMPTGVVALVSLADGKPSDLALWAAAPTLLEAAQLVISVNDRITSGMMSTKSNREAKRIAETGGVEFTETLETLRQAISAATGQAGETGQ